MVKFTTTLAELITSELNKAGYSEYANMIKNPITGELKKQYTFTNEDYSYIYLNINDKGYFKDITNDYVFQGNQRKTFNQVFINEFTSMFMARFWNKQIKFQTHEMFRLTLKSLLATHGNSLNYLYDNMEKYLGGVNTSNSNSENLQNLRSLSSTLPDNSYNLNVDDNVIYSPDNNDISNNRTKNIGDDKSQKYDIMLLEQIDNYLENFMLLCSKKLFINIY